MIEIGVAIAIVIVDVGGTFATARAAVHTDIEYGKAAGVSLRLDVSVPDGAGPWHLVASTRRQGFRAVLARAHWRHGHWCLAAADAARLGLDEDADRGMRLRAAPLAQGSQVQAATGPAEDAGDEA